MASPAFPRSRTALLLLDVINLFDFPDGPKFARAWLPSSRRIARLRERAHRAGIPVVYVNDNFGRWRSDFAALVEVCSKDGQPGAGIAQILKPAPQDFFVLKPHLSGFHETPLNMLLQSGGVRTVIVAGYAADNCVLFTAADAHMLQYRVVVPADCVAAEQDSERRHVLAKMRKFLDAKTTVSTRLSLRR